MVKIPIQRNKRKQKTANITSTVFINEKKEEANNKQQKL